MTPEAIALHAIDLMDARIHIAVREIAEDRGDSAWTPYNAAMGRRLYKGGRPAAKPRPTTRTDPCGEADAIRHLILTPSPRSRTSR